MNSQPYEPVHEILVRISYMQKPPLKAHADISSRAKSLNLSRSLHLHPNFVYVSSEGSGKSAFSQTHLCLQCSTMQ